MRSHTISAVLEASGTTWLIVPKRVLSWWWSMLTIGAPPISTALRSKLPQSKKTIVRCATSCGTSEIRSSPNSKNAYS